MSTVVYFNFPAYGHINPTLTIITELVRRGEQVYYYALERFRPVIEATGATFCDYGPAFSVLEDYEEAFSQLETTMDALLTLSQAILTHHLEATRSMQPDYIMHEAFCPWGKFIAQSLHLPTLVSVPSIAADLQFAADQMAEQLAAGTLASHQRSWWESIQPRLVKFSKRFGLPKLAHPYELLQVYGDLNLVYTSRYFQPMVDSFDAQRFQFVGPCLRPSSEKTDFPFEALNGRPVLYISLGTLFNNRNDFFQMCFEAFSHSDWQVVMVTGSVPLSALGPIPDNFIVRPFAPQLDLLKRTALFITHGGMNSVNEALFFDVPLLIVPQGGDQFWIAQRAAELGAAQVLSNTQLTPEQLRQSVEHIATSSEYAEAARKIGASLRTAGGVQKAVASVEAFKQEHVKEAQCL